MKWPWELEIGLTSAAEFGDSFGFINSLMSAAALAGVIVAIWLQKQELEAQRNELNLTRRELKKSAEAQEKQARVHFQATILTAIEGLEQSTTNPELVPLKSERETNARFIERVRQAVVIDILSDGDADPVDAVEFASDLMKWRKLCFVVNTCREVANRCESILNKAQSSGNYLDRNKIPGRAVPVGHYVNLLAFVKSVRQRLDESCGALEPLPSTTYFTEWSKKAELNYGNGHDHREVVEQLGDLEITALNMQATAENNRAKMFE